MLKIDEIDHRLIYELEQDSRLSMSELGRRIKLSAPSVNERVRRLESFGVIKQYSLELDYEKLGLPIQCIVEATVKNGQYEAFLHYLKQQPTVSFCYRISGDACYLIKIQFSSFSAAESFIDEIIPYAQTKTQFIFSEIDIQSK
ncbi:MAG: Lrp/AsnC family transcriptional regulator [Paracoccaceae bacterium]|nr:MAG: Lrp/AsnC family transcriptional regulator [Paracoccaceae bacterium]